MIVEKASVYNSREETKSFKDYGYIASGRVNRVFKVVWRERKCDAIFSFNNNK